MKPHIETIYSPLLLDLYDVTDTIVVIIDVFRATSTVAAALYNGAVKIIPVSSVEDCIRYGKEELNAVTAGEREGKVIPGLQYGNSPAEYPRSFIEGKTLVLTTTNGTRLLHLAFRKGASEIITGSFPNLNTVVEYLKNSGKNILLGCSGWKNRINLEDTLFAGAVASRLQSVYDIHCDSTLMAMDLYQTHQNDLLALARQATHWHRLEAFGLAHDLEYCVTPNVANVLPYFKDGALWKK